MPGGVTFKRKVGHLASIEGFVGGFLQFCQATLWRDIHAMVQFTDRCLISPKSAFKFRAAEIALHTSCAWSFIRLSGMTTWKRLCAISSKDINLVSRAFV